MTRYEPEQRKSRERRGKLLWNEEENTEEKVK